MEHFGNSLLEVVHRAHKIRKVLSVLGGVLSQVIIHRSDEEQDLAPMNVGWIPNLLLTRLPCPVLLLPRNVGILLIQSLHDVGSE